MAEAHTTDVSTRTGWRLVLDEVAEAFAMSADEHARFVAHPLTRLVAALPFLANADRPERTAAIHLATYILSVRQTKPYFHAAESEDGDVFSRLEPIARFDGGDPKVIERGMAILAINMVSDYKRDQHIDELIGKHNPVADGEWDADAIIADLRSLIDRNPCPAMDEAVDGGEGTEVYWTW